MLILWKGESLKESIKRHEHSLTLQLGLKPGQKVLDVGCIIGRSLREIARFSSTSLTGINNNEYQITRGNEVNRVAGVGKTCDPNNQEHQKIKAELRSVMAFQIHIQNNVLQLLKKQALRICREPFGLNYPWIFRCESCRYFVHLDCATSRSAGKTIKNFEDADHPNLLNLPFPDHTYSILQHWVSKESGSTTVETSERNLKHIRHEHVLNRVGTQSNDSKGASSSSVSLVSCHNPMKRIELLCNGCVRPIMDVPFYKCSNEDQRCDFVLHEWCTRLPAELPNYPGHTHSLSFLPKVLENIFGIFNCKICNLPCNGFAYGCTECEYYIDVNCAFIPDEITHEAHLDHILSRCDRRSMRKECVAEGRDYWGRNNCFSCESCDFYLHSDCALFLPRIINHKLDKHPMKLTYGPVENHKSEYFCEVCEEELDPTKWFYHCHVCAYSLHTRCAPVILNFEATIPSSRSLYVFLNIKFGGIYNIEGHEHSVSLAPGSDADGECPICDYHMRYQSILKCQKCKVAMHYYCCRRL